MFWVAPSPFPFPLPLPCSVYSCRRLRQVLGYAIAIESMQDEGREGRAGRGGC